MGVKAKYLKDENGDVFSPIVSTDSVLTAGGEHLRFNLSDWINLFKC